MLSKDGDLVKDIEKAIRKTFSIMDQGYKDTQQNKGSSSETSVNICLVIGTLILI